MINFLKKSFSTSKIEEIENAVIAAENYEQAWNELQPLLRAHGHQKEAAISLLRITEGQHVSIERGLELLSSIYHNYIGKMDIVSLIGSALEGGRDIDQLNSAPPEHHIFQTVLDALLKGLNVSNDQHKEEMIMNGVSTAARLMARQHDVIAEKSHRRLVELAPSNPSYHYCYGLYCKTRGLFAEGMFANQKAVSLVDESVESYEWNLGICATGARDGEVALDVWKRMGNNIEMGRFNLPEGGYPQCKVRLAERPLSERDASNDDPGLEETVWIERLSPCHGIIRSVLYQNLGINYGDVVLIDGAPITYHTYGDQQIPVFPHLATLVRNDYLFFDFAATQNEKGQVGEISSDLEQDAIVYVHSENYQVLCSECWRDPNLDHKDHKKEEKHIVTGRIAAPNNMAIETLLMQIDNVVGNQNNCNIYIPSLCEAVGLKGRAEADRRRFEMLTNNS